MCLGGSLNIICLSCRAWRALEDPWGEDCDTCEAGVEGEGSWGFQTWLISRLWLWLSYTDGLALIDAERWARLFISLFRSLLSIFFCLAMRSVLALSDHPVVDTGVGAREANLKMNDERTSNLVRWFASNETEVVAKVAQVNSVEGSRRLGEEGRQKSQPLYLNMVQNCGNWGGSFHYWNRFTLRWVTASSRLCVRGTTVRGAGSFTVESSTFDEQWRL